MNDSIVIALPKGRLSDDSLALFAEASALASLRFALASDWLADAFDSAALCFDSAALFAEASALFFESEASSFIRSIPSRTISMTASIERAMYSRTSTP